MPGSSAYPAALDNFDIDHLPAELVGPDLENTRAAINNMQTELGVNPSGTESTVANAVLSDQAVLYREQQILTATFDRRCAPVVVGSYASGTIRAGAVVLRAGQTVNKLGICIVTVGVAITAARLGVYSKTYARLAQTADISSSFQSAGWQVPSLTTPLVITVTDVYYLAVFQTYSTSAALMVADNPAGVTNAREAIGSGIRAGAKQTGQSGLTDPLVPTESGFMPLLVATA